MTIGATSHPIASITAARLNSSRDNPAASLVYLVALFPIRTAKLFLTVDTGIVHSFESPAVENKCS